MVCRPKSAVWRGPKRQVGVVDDRLSFPRAEMLLVYPLDAERIQPNL